jgi:hypothetical protein
MSPRDLFSPLKLGQAMPEFRVQGPAYFLGYSFKPRRWFEGEPMMPVPILDFGEGNPTVDDLTAKFDEKLSRNAGKLLLYAAQDNPPVRAGDADLLEGRLRDRLGEGAKLFLHDGYLVGVSQEAIEHLVIVWVNDRQVTYDSWTGKYYDHARLGVAVLDGRGLAAGRLA